MFVIGNLFIALAVGMGQCMYRNDNNKEIVVVKKNEAYFDELETIKALAEELKLTAFCPLGQSVASPVLSALKYFGKELVQGVNPDKKHEPVTRENPTIRR